MKQAYDLAFRFSGNHDAAEDISQEAFIRAFESLSSFRGDAAFSTWLHRIVVNLSLNSAHRVKKHAPLDGTDHDEATGTDRAGEESFRDPDERAHVERALHELPTLQRAVVILRHLEGLSTRQVSEILKCSEGTVKTHLFRGLRNMRRRLGFLRGEA